MLNAELGHWRHRLHSPDRVRWKDSDGATVMETDLSAEGMSRGAGELTCLFFLLVNSLRPSDLANPLLRDRTEPNSS